MSFEDVLKEGLAWARTPKQNERVVHQEALPRCAGTPKQECPVHPKTIHVMYAGFDQKDRCDRCNRIHHTLVYKEAGETPPDTPSVFVTPSLDRKADEYRRKQIVEMAHRVKGGDTFSTRQHSPTQPSEAAAPGKTSADRLKALKRKYGI
jgi:hypothetical protein